MAIEIKNRWTNAIMRTVDGADLSGADLSGADLRSADLRSANLWSADLRSADLRSADLWSANLSGANLSGANLSGANLSGANLRSANLRSANLSSANLSSAKGLSQFIVAGSGALRGWKKTTAGVVELSIPTSAARVNAYGSRKCRAEFAVVIDAPDGALSLHDRATKYEVGSTVRPDWFEADPRIECAPGIHFFITREEAEEYS